MSEDEFVVLVEHAGLVEMSEATGQEYVDISQLHDWLQRDGLELLSARFLHKDDQLSRGLIQSKQRGEAADKVIRVLLEKEWLVPLRCSHESPDPQTSENMLYATRLPTVEAYKIYIEKDISEDALSSTSWTKALQELSQEGSNSPPEPSHEQTVESVDEWQKYRTREKLWYDCFPMCSESCKQMFLAFENPAVILYSTMGLNLISNGISSVPAFSRELKGLGLSAEDRTVIVGFLARAFPM